MNESAARTNVAFDPVLLAVISNRFDAIVREMTNTLLRAARSAVLAVARDFSCSISTADGRLLATAEGVPVHVFGSQLQAASIVELHPERREGDAYLHNDPYLGNSHAADQSVLVPVFFEGEHLFTAVAKAHQADCGNSIPSSYHAAAKDVYEEGSLIFPCVLVQRDFKDVDDIIRMCRKRIRVPDQWYGDYLAAIGAARIAERRMKELAVKYGRETLKKFIEEWFDYSERRMINAIRMLPKGRLHNRTCHDPIPGILPEGVPIQVSIEVDPEAAMIDVDLRDNIDCVPCGLNESMACTTANVMIGVFNSLEWDIPHNSGTFRRIRVHLREHCVVGIPRFPHSCSVATTNVGDRLVNMTQAAFAKISDGHGLAEGNTCLSAGCAVVSGHDARRGDGAYINQMFLMSGGGPASPSTDGWVNYVLPDAGGLLYRDSIELDEQKYPIHVKSQRLVPDSGGAGRQRGSPGTEVIYGPRNNKMRIVIQPDGCVNPPQGVQGGRPGAGGANWWIDKDGTRHRIIGLVDVSLTPGQNVVGVDGGGGGYGDPLTRDSAKVLKD
ncbi:MAG: hydantoinase B/oxoprolinase family protein, partial [Alphaproteobacteria bacterium]|nr:hydantoinase B/oxoprolinase family protein [Alphaproteobacteria bacterium]